MSSTLSYVLDGEASSSSSISSLSSSPSSPSSSSHSDHIVQQQQQIPTYRRFSEDRSPSSTAKAAAAAVATATATAAVENDSATLLVQEKRSYSAHVASKSNTASSTATTTVAAKITVFQRDAAEMKDLSLRKQFLSDIQEGSRNSLDRRMPTSPSSSSNAAERANYRRDSVFQRVRESTDELLRLQQLGRLKMAEEDAAHALRGLPTLQFDVIKVHHLLKSLKRQKRILKLTSQGIENCKRVSSSSSSSSSSAASSNGVGSERPQHTATTDRKSVV